MSESNHHSMGTPWLSTKSLYEFLSSSERRQTSQAGLFSILTMESQMFNYNDWVERSGTGIIQAKANACEASLNFKTDSVERIVDRKHEII
jgi:hypothetical protein